MRSMGAVFATGEPRVRRWLKRLGRLSAAGAVVVVGGTLCGEPARAKSLGEMATEAANDLANVTGLVAIVFYLIGALVVGFGLLKLKRTVDQPQQGGAGAGIAAIVLGAALIVAPSVINAVTDTAGADGTETLQRPRL